MKAKQVTDLLEELKKLRRKVKKSAEAQEKVEHKLDQVVMLVKHFAEQLPADQQPQTEHPPKKSKKKSKHTEEHLVETNSVAADSQ